MLDILPISLGIPSLAQAALPLAEPERFATTQIVYFISSQN